MKIVSWNTEGRLTRFARAGKRGSPEQIVSLIKTQAADVVFLPEAFDGARSIEPAILSQLDSLGYNHIAVSYDETKDRRYQAVIDPSMMLLTRHMIIDHRTIRPGDIRTMLMADIEDAASKEIIRFFGVHIDDRNEANRLRQIEELIPLILESPYPVVVLGDFNAMHGDSFMAKMLRSRLARFIVSKLPHSMLRDVTDRLTQMAIGKTMERIKNDTDLIELDTARRPTMTPKMRGLEWLPSIRLVQIDHIFTSPSLAAMNFRVARDGGSDHRAISIEIDTTRQKR